MHLLPEGIHRPIHQLQENPIKANYAVHGEHRHTINQEKAIELIFRIFFKKLTPKSDFDFLAEIEKIDSFGKSRTFNKMYAKRLFMSIKYLTTHYKKQGIDLEPDKPLNQAGNGDSLQKIHSDYLPSLILFHDKWIILTMREVMGVLVMSKFAQQFLESAPKRDFKRLVHIISGTNFAEIPYIRSILKNEEVLEMENMPVDNDSLFNFSTHSNDSHHSPKSRFSFALSNFGSNL